MGFLLNKAFSSFFAENFGIIFENFFKWSAHLKALRNFEKSSNMAKNEEKPCSTYLMKPIFRLTTPNIRFRVPE